MTVKVFDNVGTLSGASVGVSVRKDGEWIRAGAIKRRLSNSWDGENILPPTAPIYYDPMGISANASQDTGSGSYFDDVWIQWEIPNTGGAVKHYRVTPKKWTPDGSAVQTVYSDVLVDRWGDPANDQYLIEDGGTEYLQFKYPTEENTRYSFDVRAVAYDDTESSATTIKYKSGRPKITETYPIYGWSGPISGAYHSPSLWYQSYFSGGWSTSWEAAGYNDNSGAVYAGYPPSYAVDADTNSKFISKIYRTTADNGNTESTGSYYFNFPSAFTGYLHVWSGTDFRIRRTQIGVYTQYNWTYWAPPDTRVFINGSTQINLYTKPYGNWGGSGRSGSDYLGARKGDVPNPNWVYQTNQVGHIQLDWQGQDFYLLPSQGGDDGLSLGFLTKYIPWIGSLGGWAPAVKWIWIDYQLWQQTGTGTSTVQTYIANNTW